MRLFVFSLFVITTFSLQSSVPFQKEIDSLRLLLKKNYSAKTQLELYIIQSTSMRHLGSFQEAIQIGQKGEKIALKINDSKGLLASYSQIGESYRELGNFDRAILYNEKILKLSKQQNDSINEGNVYDQLGHIYFSRGDTLASIKYHELALKMRIQCNDIYGIGNSYESLASIYAQSGDYQRAVKHYKSCLNTFKKLDKEQARIARAAANVGLVYKWISRKKEAITYFKMAADIYEKINDIDGLTWTYNFLGELYSQAENFEQSLYYNSKVLEISKRENRPAAQADAYRNRADIYYLLRKYDEALQLVERNIDFYGKQQTNTSLIVSYIQLGKIYQAKNDFEKAINAYKKSLELAKSINNAYYIADSKLKLGTIYYQMQRHQEAISNLTSAVPYFMQIQEVDCLSSSHLIISQAYKALNNDKLAFTHLELHLNYFKINAKNKDAFENEISKLDSENKYLKERMEANKSASLLEKKLNRSRTERNTAIYGLVIVLLTGGFIYYLFLLTKRKSRVDKMLIKAHQNENKIIRETELFKSQFLVNISHELKTPLTLINGHVELLEETTALAENDHLMKIKKNGRRLLKLINDIIHLSKAENGQYQLIYKQGSILSEIEALFRTFQSQAELLQIDYTFTSTFNEYSDFNKQFVYSLDALTIIVTNLLSNAFKFTPEGGTITVKVEHDNNNLRISISDTGTGISENNLDKIFDRFYQDDQLLQRSYDSSGIGLSLVRELTTLHGGKIEVQNKTEEGCVFSATLKSGNPLEISEATHYEQESNRIETEGEKNQEETLVNDDLPIVLVVEDHKDLRDFIVSILSKEYKCITAINGEDGLKKAIEHIPDLILSDVMMPLMDGITFSKKIRNMELTSHIPIILLTAKSDQEHVVQGLIAGSNDYISKPFSPIELTLKIKNQIAILQRIQEQFKNEKEPTNKRFDKFSTLNKRDKEFMDKIFSSINMHITNYQLGVELIAEDLALSSSQLTRKLKSLTGLTPGMLIKEVRLESAKEMLENGYSVSEVAYKIGYENPAYFSKIFKAHFGSQPSKMKN